MTAKKLLGPIAAMLVVGAAGTGLIKQSEGLRYKVYLDEAKIPTVCYGHTGPDVAIGQPARTQEQCDILLKNDLKRFDAALNQCIKAPVNQNQYDAIVSLTFNIGTQAACNSTLIRKVNALDYAGAAAEFPRWNKIRINGVPTVSAGLSARREREKALFERKVPK